MVLIDQGGEKYIGFFTVPPTEEELGPPRFGGVVRRVLSVLLLMGDIVVDSGASRRVGDLGDSSLSAAVTAGIGSRIHRSNSVMHIGLVRVTSPITSHIVCGCWPA